MTSEFINDMLVRFKENKRIHKKYVFLSGYCSDVGLSNTVGY